MQIGQTTSRSVFLHAQFFFFAVLAYLNARPYAVAALGPLLLITLSILCVRAAMSHLRRLS